MADQKRGASTGADKPVEGIGTGAGRVAQNDAPDGLEGTSGETALTHEEALDKGYMGAKVDPTPNEAYTVDGVTTSGQTYPDVTKADDKR